MISASMKKRYDDEVLPLLKNYYKISITQNKYNKISKYVQNLIQIKSHENDYKRDHDVLFQRYITGLLGEAALEEVLGISIIEWNIKFQ